MKRQHESWNSLTEKRVGRFDQQLIAAEPYLTGPDWDTGRVDSFLWRSRSRKKLKKTFCDRESRYYNYPPQPFTDSVHPPGVTLV